MANTSFPREDHRQHLEDCARRLLASRPELSLIAVRDDSVTTATQYLVIIEDKRSGRTEKLPIDYRIAERAREKDDDTELDDKLDLLIASTFPP